VKTRRQLLLLLRKRPGITVSELASELRLSGMGVRRHLEALTADGLVEAATCAKKGVGRPPAGWRLSSTGMELFPRRYDALALDILEDLEPDEVGAVFRRRTDKQVAEYEAELAASTDPADRVAGLSRLREQAGYLAEWSDDGEGTFVLTENNCAVHRVAERHPVVCAVELSLLKRVMGPNFEVVRVAHTMAGDAVCSYCIRRRDVDDAGE
jgi:predicted ArsR family transcriptional regulator